MPCYIAFLRGINLGRRRIKMDQLAALFRELKFSNVATFIASGNVAFDSRQADCAQLEAKIESHLAQQLGYAVDTFVRTRAEVVAATGFAAFPAREVSVPDHTVHVGFLKSTLHPDAARQMVACRTPVDELVVHGREFYWLCRIRTSDSKVWTSPGMKAVKLPTVTMRNLKMLRRLILEFPVSAPG